jgi:hypothetical protein
LQAPPIAPPVAPRAPIDHPGVNSDGTSKIVRHPLASPRSTRVSTGEAESVREAKVSRAIACARSSVNCSSSTIGDTSGCAHVVERGLGDKHVSD